MRYYKYKKSIKNHLLIFLAIIAITNCSAQNNPSIIFDREIYKPFKAVYIGGYINTSLNYFEKEGETEGVRPVLNRAGAIAQINLFKYLSIYGEFEHNKVNDFQINSLFAKIGNANIGLNVGYIGFPLGKYKQYHIRKDRFFIEHPLMITKILTGINCDSGIGIYANVGNAENSRINFELNLVSGLNEDILYTPSANTNMIMGTSKSLKINDNNDNLMVNARLGLLQNNVFEIGASILTGQYTNRIKEKSSTLTKSKNLQIYVFDAAFYFNRLRIESEIAINNIELPANILELYANNQRGHFVDLSYELFNKESFLWKSPLKVFTAVRYDYVDLNNGYLAITKEKINNEYHKVTLGLSGQLLNKTSVILNGSYQWFSDMLGNPSKRTVGVQVGLNSFF